VGADVCRWIRQEAAWILRRRENQMKELVVQKKLNQEMEAKARAKSEEIAAQLAERERQARRLQRVKDGLDDVSSVRHAASPPHASLTRSACHPTAVRGW
jgi:hypothetical protein